MKSKQSYILNRGITTMLIAAMLLFIVAVFGAQNTYAAEESGEYKGISWRITDAGVLELGKAGETQELSIQDNKDYEWDDINRIGLEGVSSDDDGKYAARRQWPWLDEGRDAKIVKVDIVGNIKLSGDISQMFSVMPNVVSMENMQRIDTSEVTNMYGLFGFPTTKGTVGCSALESIEGIDSWNVKKVRHFSSMFSGSRKLKKLDLSKWETPSMHGCEHMFGYCEEIEEIKFGQGFDTSGANSIGHMFRECKKLKSVDVSMFNTENMASIYGAFRGCSSLESIDISSWDTSNVIDMRVLFQGCEKLTTITGLSNFDTSNVEYMSEMFECCRLLESLDVSSFDTRNVTTMKSMFRHCNSIPTLDISKFDTSKVTDMWGMFQGLHGITEIDVSKLDTGNVTDMGNMFVDCGTVTSLDLSKFDTSNVKNMNGMFGDNESLKEIKGLENLDTSNVTNMSYMFNNASSIETADMLGLCMKSLENADGIFDRNADAAIKAVLQKKADDALTAGDDETAALYQEAKAAIDRWKTANADEKYDAIKDASKAYSKAIIEEAKTKAKAAIEEANTKEMAASVDPANANKAKEAKEALKAAHNAVNKVSGLAENTDRKKDKDDAKALSNQLSNGAEALAKTRHKNELTSALDSAKTVDTTNKSGTSVKALNEAIAKAEEVLADENATALDVANAKEGLAEAVNSLEDKSDAEKAYDSAKATAEEAKAVADTAKTAMDAAVTAASNSKAAADEAVAKATSSGKAEDYDAAAKAAEKAAADADRAKAAADAYKQASDAYEEKADKAYEAAKATGDKGLRKEAYPAKREAEENGVSATEGQKVADALEKATDTLALDMKLKAVEAYAAQNPSSPEGLAAGNAAVEALQKALAAAKAENPQDPAKIAALEAQLAKALEAQKTIQNAQQALKVGDIFEVGGQKYEVLSLPSNGNCEAALAKGRNAKSVSVPKTVVYDGKTFDVTEINTKAFYKKTKKVTVGANVDRIDKQAFRGSKVSTVVLKTKELTKKSIKGSLKKSKVKTIKVKVGGKKANRKYVKKYKKIFTKKNAGKKVTVK